MSGLNNIALKILNNGKGILAADESTATMTKRLESVKVQSTAENRLLFRETLFSASGMTEYIGGVILYDETIKQITSKKNKIPELISAMGSTPGIKVDTGAKVLAGSPNEKITEGLDGLRERLKEYYKLGAKFTKWRGVYKISNDEVAKLTLKCLKDSVPSEVPGIAFLSGGQSEIEATENLHLINKYLSLIHI